MAEDWIASFPHVHSEVAWSHFLAQHLGKPNTESYVKSFYPPLDVLDKAQYDLLTKRWIETAEGLQLDGIGSIVGLPRELQHSVFLPFFGFIQQPAGKGFSQARIRHNREPYAASRFMGDIEYQQAIIAKIALNNAHGTANDIIANVNFALGVTGTTVMDMYDAEASVLINDLTITTADPRAALLDQIIPSAAGVRIWPDLINAAHTFGFANQIIYFGFGVGVLARRYQSNIPVIPPINPPTMSSPALDLNFLTGILDSRITFSRTSTATYFDVAGVLQTAATNVPRFGYDPITHAPRGLLIEELKTNLVFPSVSGGTPWTGSGTGTRTSNSGVAPDGTNTAAQIVADATAGVHGFVLTLTPGANTVYTQSIFAKAGTSSRVSLEFRVAGGWLGGVCYAVFDLAAGTVVSYTGTGPITATITPVGNGWYRLTATATSAAAPPSSSFWANVCNAAGVDSFVGTGESALFWGWQVEPAAFASSYIPTTGTTAQRSGDVATMPIDTWYNPSQSNTLVVSCMMPQLIPTASTQAGFIVLDDNTNNNRIMLRAATPAACQAAYTVANVSTVTATAGNFVAGTPFKLGASLISTGLSTSLNGATPIVPTGAAPTGLTTLRFGRNNTTSFPINGYIRSVQCWPVALSNANLQLVTT